MIKIIEAPVELTNLGDIRVFLAGGICNVPNWQEKVCIKLIEKFKDDSNYNVTVFNPRRENFPIHDKSAAFKQIKWEHAALDACNIFSMFFSAGESDQPICMFEYGKYLEKYISSKRFDINTFIVTAEPDYRRYDDVIIQTALEDPLIVVNKTLDMHISKIINAISFKNKGYNEK